MVNNTKFYNTICFRIPTPSSGVEDLKKPVVLIFDGHNSHMTFKTIIQALEHNIILLCLIPHASHRLQPLDVGFFAPFKIIWRAVLKNWAKSTRYTPVTKDVFPTLLKEAWEKADKNQDKPAPSLLVHLMCFQSFPLSIEAKKFAFIRISQSSAAVEVVRA